MDKIRVYFAHPMEGLLIPEESGERAWKARELLGDKFKLLIPEEWQHVTVHENIQSVDLVNLRSADVILADFYRMGLIKPEGTVLGRGTNQEVGFAKGCNYIFKLTNKPIIPIVQVLRQTVNFHPFDKEEYGVVNVHSLEEACEYIKKEIKI